MIKVKDLSAAAIDEKPQDADWQNLGVGMGFEFWQATTCDNCGRATLNGEECEHCQYDNGYGEGPMMNYYYPLPRFTDDPGDAALLIADLPLCIVRFEDGSGYGLALTGGGMDLSWEICEAYIRLGYLPPIHFAGLPRMAEQTKKAQLLTVSAMRKSLEITKQRAAYALNDLDGIEDWLKARA